MAVLVAVGSYSGLRRSKPLEMVRLYLKNAYRVRLTRARQGMILFVPTGDVLDRTRPPSFYDGTFEYLHACGIPVL